MCLLKIARLGHPVIRGETITVSLEELKSQIQNLIDNMTETMRDADGVGLAAPQVHIAKRIIIAEVSPDNPRYPRQYAVPLTIVINPVVEVTSDQKEDGWANAQRVCVSAQVSKFEQLSVYKKRTASVL